ncbi:homoprotocatechuate degradation operon regulator HpaR [Kumtagia ephedrae]|uniref:Homoprotocatechuate degradation operon regulator HpaR n=1 Tax=Kumtagia ephedrae TaxID=2116701 RepID=A0A2P7SRQ2_9HYPH|nr:homoprotocatechuate degradation operon regulator HpaR [Mesorhizobium ephedrae]PSJ65141.1 homoprotocatechuate degradation operon regulator HpaR [Mesorhizobium ephedrae]
MKNRRSETAKPRTGETASTPRPARRSLAIELLRAREAVMSHFRPILAAHDVSEQQWRVIRVLSEEGTLDATEVAEKAFILPPSLTRMIRSLEERGFITRQKDEADGRRVLLRLAPSGQAVIDAVMPHSLRAYAEIDARFGAERRERLLELLGELAALKADRPASE